MPSTDNASGAERLSGHYAVGVINCRPAAEVVAAVKTAEQLGAEMAFIAEDVGCRDAFELAADAARVTARIRLATGVVNPYTRNPMSLAMATATLDEISNGRATLGLGTSSPSLVRDMMGIEPGNPTRVMEEATVVVRSLLTGRSTSHAGTRFAYVDARLEVLPVQPSVPIFFAAMGSQMLRLAGRVADGVLLNVGASTRYVRWAVDQIRRGLQEADRPLHAVTVAAWLAAYVTDDYGVGLSRARQGLARMLSVPRQGELLLQRGGLDTSILADIRTHFQAYPHRGDLATAAVYVPPEVAEQLALVGSKPRVIARLAEYREAGVELPVFGIDTLRALCQL